MRSTVISSVLFIGNAASAGCSGSGSTDESPGADAVTPDAVTADAVTADAAIPDAGVDGAPAPIDGGPPPDGSVDAAANTPPVQLRVLAFNDFHGQLEPTTVTTSDGRVEAGGAAYLAAHLEVERAGAPHSVTVSAGDLVGGSPLLSATFHDEPTILAMNAMGLDLNGVGNHEFDEDIEELLRLEAGGCHPQFGCFGDAPFAGAAFEFLGANVVDRADGAPLFTPYVVREFDGVPVAFIGLTLRDTPSTTTPIAAHVEFVDEVQTVNELVPVLQAQGIEAIVVLLHQGGGQLGGPSACLGLGGPIVALAAAFDPAVDVVVSGHTHQAYVCDLDGKLVSSAGALGVFLTVIDLSLDRETGDVIEQTAENVLVDHGLMPEPNVAALVASAQVATAPVANAVVGRIVSDLTRTEDAAGQSTLGAVVADAQLAATADESVVAFMNPGGLRADLTYPATGAEAEDGQVTFGEAFAVQPFNNLVVTMTLTGEQLHRLVEQQFVGDTRPLLVSAGFEYTISLAGALGPAIALDSIRIDGAPIDPDATYRVTTNSYLATGGNGYTVFTEGLDVTPRLLDIDALTAYLDANSPVAPPALDRVHLGE